MDKNYEPKSDRNRKASKADSSRSPMHASNKRSPMRVQRIGGMPLLIERSKGMFGKGQELIKNPWGGGVKGVDKMVKKVYNVITKPFYFLTKTKMENQNKEQPSLKLGNNLPLKKIAMWSAIIMAFGIVSTAIGVMAIDHDPIDAITFDLAEVSAELQAEKILDAQQDAVIEEKVAENKETEARVKALSDKKAELIDGLNNTINAPLQTEKEVF